MQLKSEVLNLTKKYHFEITEQNEDNIINHPLGLGDLMGLFCCLKWNFFKGPIYINLFNFELYYQNPINYLEFRLKLIRDILISNNISDTNIIFYYNSDKNTTIKPFIDFINCNNIKQTKISFNLKQNEQPLNDVPSDYIVFHTKCRFSSSKEKVLIDLKIFENYVRTLKTKYKIYILGEKKINHDNFEVVRSDDIITQIYDILINLSNNNEVVDKTVDFLIDNLNYENFTSDLLLIQNAKCNIHFGSGGSLCTTLHFGKNNSIIYNNDMGKWDLNSLEKENTYVYDDVNLFINKINLELDGEKSQINHLELRKLQKDQERVTIKNKLHLQKYINTDVIYKSFKQNKSAYFLCHGGLGDLFNNCGAIRFLSFFYKKIYLFCTVSSLENMRILFTDINIEFIAYEKWYENFNTINEYPKVSEDWYIKAIPILSKINTDFDWEKYINTYQDLSHLTKEEALFHYQNIGIVEGRKYFTIDTEFELFDWKTYTNTYQDLSHITNKADAWHHYQNCGSVEGRKYFMINTDFDLFDWKEYINNYKDLIHLSKEGAWNHYKNFGNVEGRKYFIVDTECRAFDWETYVNTYKDISYISSKEAAWHHYKNFGKTEGRTKFTLDGEGELFDWIKYVNSYSDLIRINNKEDAWHHYINFGSAEGRTYFTLDSGCDLFDWRTYLNTYKDLSNINNRDDALDHYKKFGKAEGRHYFTVNQELLFSDIFIAGHVFKNINDYVTIETQEKYNNYRPFTKITNNHLINFCDNILSNDSKLTIPWKFIEDSYRNIHLDLGIYLSYFHIQSTQKSLELYALISNYKIVFLHFISSSGESYIPESEWPHIYQGEYLIINPDKNHYKPEESLKYELANKYLNLLALDYIDIILHASDIYVCDSCFSSLVYPLRRTDRLQAENIIIYDRFYPHKNGATPKPVKL